MTPTPTPNPAFSSYVDQSLCVYDNSASPCSGLQTGSASWSRTATSPEVWKDNVTGLYWSNYKGDFTNQLSTSCGYYSTVPRGDWGGADCGSAIDYCAGLSQEAVTGGGVKTNWYLPTKREMDQAYLNSMFNASNQTFTNPLAYSQTYWSSTQSATSTNAWGVCFKELYKYDGVKSTSIALRCVYRD